MRTTIKQIIIMLLLILWEVPQLTAQEHNDAQSDAQANNPLANMTAFNIQNYYTSKLTSAPADAYMNTGWLRFAKPFAKG
ncbi:MAG TPA: hypothetical protein VIN10_09315, partial [Bacteroidales bacterium]